MRVRLLDTIYCRDCEHLREGKCFRFIKEGSVLALEQSKVIETKSSEIRSNDCVVVDFRMLLELIHHEQQGHNTLALIYDKQLKINSILAWYAVFLTILICSLLIGVANHYFLMILVCYMIFFMLSLKTAISRGN